MDIMYETSDFIRCWISFQETCEQHSLKWWKQKKIEQNKYLLSMVREIEFLDQIF